MQWQLDEDIKNSLMWEAIDAMADPANKWDQEGWTFCFGGWITRKAIARGIPVVATYIPPEYPPVSPRPFVERYDWSPAEAIEAISNGDIQTFARGVWGPGADRVFAPSESLPEIMARMIQRDPEGAARRASHTTTELPLNRL